MSEQILIDQSLECQISQFWGGINIFLFNQHYVNRRLAGTMNEIVLKFSLDENNKIDYFTELINIDLDPVKFIDSVKNLKTFNNIEVIDLKRVQNGLSEGSNSKVKYLILHKLIPRSYKLYKSCYTVSLVGEFFKQFALSWGEFITM